MGEAKRRRESGKALARTELDREQARKDKLWRIERQRNGDAKAIVELLTTMAAYSANDGPL